MADTEVVETKKKTRSQRKSRAARRAARAKRAKNTKNSRSLRGTRSHTTRSHNPRSHTQAGGGVVGLDGDDLKVSRGVLIAIIVLVAVVVLVCIGYFFSPMKVWKEKWMSRQMGRPVRSPRSGRVSSPRSGRGSSAPSGISMTPVVLP